MRKKRKGKEKINRKKVKKEEKSKSDTCDKMSTITQIASYKLRLCMLPKQPLVPVKMIAYKALS